jgi:hypothetical protein
LRVDRRLEKLEAVVYRKDQAACFLLCMSDEDEKEQVTKLEAENPGKQYHVIRIVLVRPPVEDRDRQ